MRIPFVIALLFYSSFNFAQGKNSGPKDSTFFINWNVGINGFTNNTGSESGYGILISEGTFGIGPFLGMGFEYRMKNNCGIHADVSAMFARRNKKRFISAFDTYYSDYDVLYAQNTLKDKADISGGLYFNTKVGLSYLLRYKEIGMFPQLIVGWQSSVQHNYEYTLREPSTNYYTNYRVSNAVQWKPYFGAGFTILFSEYDLAAISGEMGYTSIQNSYTIRESSYGQAILSEEITTRQNQLYWKLSILLRMDFALIK